MSPGIRQKHTPRIFFDEQVTLFVPGASQPMQGRARNLSQGGMFIQADRLLPESTPVGVRFALPDGQLVFAQARVVRRINTTDGAEPDGMALGFEAFGPDCDAHIDRFVGQRLKPAAGNTLRIELEKHGQPIRVRQHASWDNMLSVDAELPFLRLGSEVVFSDAAEGGRSCGCIRWVSMHTLPGSAVPRINIGIEMARPDGATVAEEYDPDADTVVDEPWADDDEDPICTREFAEHSRRLDERLRNADS